MKRALTLARRGEGYVEPNPMVGAVVCAGGEIVGEGYHRRFGGAHAEIVAMAAAGKRSRGADLHVTLEPCNHQGKTPACCDAIIEAGISRVFIGSQDPNASAKTSAGIRKLRRAGITVSVGELREETDSLIRPFTKFVTTGLPYVTAKWATTLDGVIATHTGDSRWITSLPSRTHAHRLRGRSDAVMVGAGTVRADDPLLTARHAKPRRSASRVIVTTDARIPYSSRLFTGAVSDPPVILFHTKAAPASRLTKLKSLGVTPVQVGANTQKKVQLKAVLRWLGKKNMTNVLLEGGAGILGSAFDAGLVDRVVIYVAPKIAGGEKAVHAVSGVGVEKIADALRLENMTTHRSGDDIRLEAFFFPVG